MSVMCCAGVGFDVGGQQLGLMLSELPVPDAMETVAVTSPSPSDHPFGREQDKRV